MKIEILSVSAINEGAEVLLTVKMTDEESGNSSKRKLLIFTDKYLELGLHKGSVIDENAFDALEDLSKTCRAIKKGSDLLSYSASSKAQLVRKLKMRGFERENAQKAAEFLENAKLIDEKENVKNAVASYLKKLWGRKRIYCELIKKGYDRSFVAEAVSGIDFDEFVENCKFLITKKVKKIPDDPIERNKLVNFLARYGYSFSEIREAISSFEKPPL